MGWEVDVVVVSFPRNDLRDVESSLSVIEVVDLAKNPIALDRCG